MGIGYRIKEAREQLGLTQTELGQKVGLCTDICDIFEGK